MVSASRRSLAGCALLLTFTLAAAAPAWADDDACPPLIPPLDMQKLFTDTTLTDAERLALMQESSREIRKPVTWSGCHIVTDKIDIFDKVTIEPGTILKFKENAGLDIQNGGALDAQGTSDQPVTFTADDETPGYWYGLYFSSNSSKNRLIYTNISYAGGNQKGTSGSVMKRAIGDPKPPTRAVMVDEGASLLMENTHITNITGYGIEVLGALRGFSTNKIDHTDIPARLQPDAVGMIDANSTFSDSTKNQIDLVALGALNHDASWVDAGVPYIWHYSETIAANLELQPGVEIQMGNDAMLSINDNASLKAIGTEDKPITIHGVSTTPGSWSGIVLNSKSEQNIWKYVRIADGGGDGYFKANIYDGGNLDISDSWIENSPRAGIRVDKNSGIQGRITMADIHYKDNQTDYLETK